MYEGYLSLGGNELLNSERARLVAENAKCPMSWFKGDRCEGMQAVDGTDYGDVTLAPWYDPVLPESARFYGAYGVSVSGIPDSTAGAGVTQSLGAGGTIGASRDATRDVRVKAMLTAEGSDALDYGMAWLGSVLKPGACGQHAGECGLTDLAFWAACPPQRGTAYDYGVVTETRRNLFDNPRGSSTSSAFWGTPANGAYSLRTDMTGEVQTAVRWTASATSSGAIRMIGGASTPSSAPITFKARVRLSQAMTLTVNARPNIASATNQVTLATLNLPAGVSEIDLTAASFTAAAGANSGVVILPGTVLVGATVDLTRVMISATGGEYFDGSTNPVYDDQDMIVGQYAWVSTADGSDSTYSTRTRTDRAQTDAEWLISQNAHRRYLHDVAKTYGPYITEEFESGPVKAYMVEFVITAERPWVFSPTFEIDLPSVLPVVVQDIPFNLAKYPSAELANPAPLLVATNYSTNPSVETDATGWTVAASGGTLTTAMLSGARDNGLAAVGSWSYKVSFVPTGSGSNGWFGAEQVVTVPEISGSPVSVTEWAAAVVTVATGLTLGVRTLTLVWRNVSNTVLRTDVIGTGPVAGGAIAGTLISPPAGATNCIVRHQVAVTAFTSASRAALYVDALALSRP